MELFKTVLNQSMQMQCPQVNLCEGKSIQFVLADHVQNQDDWAPVSAPWIKLLFRNIFPDKIQQLEPGKPVSGEFPFGQFAVKYVAEMEGELSLRLFLPPRGDVYFNNYMSQKNPAAQTAAPILQQQPVMPAPTAPTTPPPFTTGEVQQNNPFASNHSSPFSPQGQGLGTSPSPFGSPEPQQNAQQANSPFGQQMTPPVNPSPIPTSPQVEANDPFAAAAPSPVAPIPNATPGTTLGMGATPLMNDPFAAAPSAVPVAPVPPPVAEPYLGATPPPWDPFAAAPAAPASSLHNMEQIIAPAEEMSLESDPSSMDLSSFSLAGSESPPLPTFADTAEDEYDRSMSPSEYDADDNYNVSHLQNDYSGNRTYENSLSNDETIVLDFSAELPGDISVGDGQNAIDLILKNMVDSRASDLHLTMGQPVIFRVDGDIIRTETGELDETSMRSYLEPIIPDLKKKELAKDWDTDFAYEVIGLGRFRVNIFRDNQGIGAVLRHIPDKILSAEQLGLPETITKLCKLGKGLILVTGPTGSGKSTTLAAMLDRINATRSQHILTIEDPIEFVHPQKKCLVNQREVGKHTAKFSTALKAALREDPDIILVGELRDLETTSIALETAETGHLVLATLHTNTAISTVDRIIDQFPADQQRIIRNMLASSLKGVIAQTLCKCRPQGRVAAYEVLIPNDAVASMIREGKNHMLSNHMQTQQSDGNILMNESLLRLVADGVIDYWEAWGKAVDKKDFEELAKRRRMPIPMVS